MYHCRLKMILSVTFALSLSGGYNYISADSNSELISATITPIRFAGYHDTKNSKSYPNPGVPIEYWYNDTVFPGENRVPSAPGCPRSTRVLRWIWFNDSPKCFLDGYEGPCGWGNKLVAQNGSNFGSCVCDCFLSGQDNGKSILESNYEYVACGQARFTGRNKTLIHIKSENRCYVAGEKGPCKEGSLLGIIYKTFGVCLPACLQNKDSGYDEALCQQRASRPYPAYFLTPYIQTSCPLGYAYSNLLNRCVRRFNLPSVIGR